MRDGTRRRLLFREVNQAIRQIGQLAGDEKYPVFCECERADCGERMELLAATYEEILGQKGRFVVVPGHEPANSADAIFVALSGDSTAEPEALSAA